jgi:hypothetical protein
MTRKIVNAAQKARENGVGGYNLLNHEVYYNQSTSKFYFKIVTATGFICSDITIDELFLKPHIIERLDQRSCNYVHYVRGRLEERANLGNTSLFTFYGISPFDNNIIIVKSLVDGTTHKWDIVEAYQNQWYLNLDKPSIGKFTEKYLLIKMLSDSTVPEQVKLKLVK